MRREDKYPNTKHFRYYNANPKGKTTCDCVTRAISVALQKPYNDVVMELAHLQCRYGYDIADSRLYDKYLKLNGWIKHKQPRKDDNKKYTGKEWCEFLQFWDNQDYRRMLAHIGTGHIAVIVEGKILDTWDSSDGCIGNFWIKGV